MFKRRRGVGRSQNFTEHAKLDSEEQSSGIRSVLCPGLNLSFALCYKRALSKGVPAVVLTVQTMIERRIIRRMFFALL